MGERRIDRETEQAKGGMYITRVVVTGFSCICGCVISGYARPPGLVHSVISLHRFALDETNSNIFGLTPYTHTLLTQRKNPFL